MACQKLGQPVPDSNLARESNSAVSQQMQRYSPSAWLALYLPEYGRSAPSWRVTVYESAGSSLRHSSSVWTTRATSRLPWLTPAAENSSIVTLAGTPGFVSAAGLAAERAQARRGHLP